MNLRTRVLVALAFPCCAAFAQEPQDSYTTTYPTAQGPLVVHWGQPEARQYGPAPAFAQLDQRGAGYLTSDEADAYRAQIVDATTEGFVFEITGKPSKIDSFIAIMVPLGLVEVVRTGLAAISRGAEGM